MLKEANIEDMSSQDRKIIFELKLKFSAFKKCEGLVNYLGPIVLSWVRSSLFFREIDVISKIFVKWFGSCFCLILCFGASSFFDYCGKIFWMNYLPFSISSIGDVILTKTTTIFNQSKVPTGIWIFICKISNKSLKEAWIEAWL